MTRSICEFDARLGADYARRVFVPCHRAVRQVRLPGRLGEPTMASEVDQDAQTFEDCQFTNAKDQLTVGLRQGKEPVKNRMRVATADDLGILVAILLGKPRRPNGSPVRT